MTRSIICTIIAIAVFSIACNGRTYEKLNRGGVAVSLGDGGNYISWRLLESDADSVGFEVYRDGVKITDNPIVDTTDLIDHEGKSDSVYSIKAVSDSAAVMASQENIVPWSEEYLEIPLSAPDGVKFGNRVFPYRPNDISVGDLDGDGEYELVVKWEGISHDNSHKGMTSPAILEGLELDGRSLWRVNLGVNIRSGAHYTPFVVFDLDGDGKAEVACKTADGTVDGRGDKIGNDKDYRNANGYILAGAEYLTVFRGTDGKAMDTVNYVPARGNPKIWGDTYGNRVDRFLAAAGWLKGDRPSLIMARGYYHGKTSAGRTAIATWDYIDGKLVPMWCFDTLAGGLDEYIGQGNHSMYVGDVDGDGYDEITYGSCAIDNDGSGLYSTGFGHGDAGHLGDLAPDRPGLEFFMPHEETVAGKIPGVDFRDARTGEVIWSLPVNRHRDIGRGVAGDITSEYKGSECWSLADGNLYSCKGEIIGKRPSSCNFLVWWDGDVTRELLDGTWIGKYSPEKRGNAETVFIADGCTSINGTKANPSLCGDILGDWREEIIWPSKDWKSLRVYTTTIPAEFRHTTLMHDAVYRLAIAWQNSGYNQPTHTGCTLN